MTDNEQIFHDFTIDPYLFYEAIENSTDDYIYIVDMTRDISLISKNMLHDFDLPGRKVHGLVPLWGELVHEKDRQRYFDSIEKMLNKETDEHNVEYQIRNRKNEYVWVICRGLLKRDQKGNPLIFAGVVTNLGSKGKIDYITGLFAQRECEKLITRLIQNECHPGGILLLGLDDFSRINALNDHIFGNTVLRQFAQTILRFLPPDADLFRFDGDEFAIVYKNASGQDLYQLYQKIHAYANRRQIADGISYFCTVSGGIAMIGADGDNYLDLIKFAASALEVSKQKGKNTCTFFSPDLIKAKLRTLEITNQLQLSIMNHMEHFHMVYQPLISNDTLAVGGAEALLRWSSETYGSVSPIEFIPVLESGGLIVPVGKWVLEQAVKTCKEWISYAPDFVMNINISYLQMLDVSFLSYIRDLLTQYQLEPRHIVLELTESYFVTDMEALKYTFAQLRNEHIKIAMDDFGTGYSSLGMLAQSPADIVKIDRIFISAINREVFNYSFISAVIQLCHSVDIQVCVEGIEYPEELETIRSIHPDSIQGFYFSKPISASDFKKRYWENH
ncbi:MULTISPECIES: EAL domain-containing protein [Robinsoniella]|uniref:Cyclic di-GMP phosphodiesterase Gmr n=1 Tax=Robinsoniella peoriensis TaxID=180332 RepID=A0A4U8Q976_9FIRM|nr:MULTISPECIES: EAL domain-containing protein [Robinsoniella]MDU7029516.1 EAL domain-containing protein [Clostridiales bacterium]TLD01467.1 Cyclic di-GMP phosphodiesterase Gmr [Robinsoniella peoriensis]